MNLFPDVQLALRAAGYDARPAIVEGTAVLGFEDASLIGFVHEFPGVESLFAEWRDAEARVLRAFSDRLRAAGDKAWNVYTVLLTAGLATPEAEQRLLTIEEDLSMTRKLARAHVTTDSLSAVLLPLLPLQPNLVSNVDDFESRVRVKLASVASANVAAALLGSAEPDALARIALAES